MNRKQFLQTSLLAAGAYFLPNVVLAIDKSSKKKSTDLIPERMLVAQPDLSDYKYNTDGEVFINTQLSFYATDKQLIQLPERHYLTHKADGYGSPTLYFDGQDYYVFVTTLFKSYLMNGFVYKYNSVDGFRKQTIYQHENMGWYAFWGQCIDGKPALYHYNYGNISMMRSQPLAADNWETERIYICQPEEAETLYHNQLKDVNYHTQAHQFGFTYPKITDGYYTFLKFLHQMNELERTDQKNIEEARETKSPTVWTSKRVPITIREIRNRQRLASETGGCGCEDKLDYTQPNDKHIRLLKITNTKADAVIYDLKKYYPTTVAYYDRNNQYHKIAETFYCLADNELSQYPRVVFDGEKYHLYLETLILEGERNYLEILQYTHNQALGFSYQIMSSDNSSIAQADFTASLENQIAISITNKDDVFEKPLNKNREKDINDSPKNTKYKPPIIYPFLPEEYPNVLQPIYCEGDDLTYANPKPKILYREVPGTKIEIPNMPAYKTQDTMGECRAFSLGAILQKYICDRFKGRIPDCKNIPSQYSISYFGLMKYTHVQKDKENTFNLFDPNYYSMNEILENVGDENGLMLLDSCNPFSNMVGSFTTDGVPTALDLKNYNEFMDYLKTTFSNWKSLNNTNYEPTDKGGMLSYINTKVGLNATWAQLKTALMKETFGQFMYSLFFESLDPIKCKPKNLPALYDIKTYPGDSENVTSLDIKNKIKEGLKRVNPSPILTPAVCHKWTKKNECDAFGHSMVISGYKKVCESDNPNNCKDLFKIHNSWGETWQKHNNDGWIDADIYTSNFILLEGRISSASVIWLE